MKCLLFILSLFFLPHVEQPLPGGWKLKKEVDGIEVFTRNVAGSNLKELKIEMSFPEVDFSTLMAVLTDTESYPEWLYKCDYAKTIEHPQSAETVDYYKFNFPWPLSDRDLYVRSVITQDVSKKELLITTTALPDYATDTDGKVRVKKHINTWHFFLSAGEPIRLVYKAKADPGGHIPDWMVNMVIDRGPTISMQNLRERIKMDKYKNQQIDWLSD